MIRFIAVLFCISLSTGALFAQHRGSPNARQLDAIGKYMDRYGNCWMTSHRVFKITTNYRVFMSNFRMGAHPKAQVSFNSRDVLKKFSYILNKNCESSGARKVFRQLVYNKKIVAAMRAERDTGDSDSTDRFVFITNSGDAASYYFGN